MITQMQLQQLNAWIDAGEEHRFYIGGAWKAICKEVRRIDRNECQICKTKHRRYRRGMIVHHVKRLKDRPDLALSIFDPDTGERQLVLVCKQCHEDEHPEALHKHFGKSAPVTVERWD